MLTHRHTYTYTDKSVFKIRITYGPESYNYQMIPIKYQSITFK